MIPMNAVPSIYLVDDDRDVRHAIVDTLETYGRHVLAFHSAESLLRNVDAESVGCVIADLHLPDMNGRQLQDQLATAAPALTVVVITGQIDVATTVEFMSRGAIAVLEKPCEVSDLLAAVAAAEAKSRSLSARIFRLRAISQRLADLSEEEREVADGMIAGTPIKALARQLRVSMRTIDRRRHSILAKMQAGSVGELACLLSEISLSEISADQTGEAGELMRNCRADVPELRNRRPA